MNIKVNTTESGNNQWPVFNDTPVVTPSSPSNGWPILNDTTIEHQFTPDCNADENENNCGRQGWPAAILLLLFSFMLHA